jgi:MFS family permease
MLSLAVLLYVRARAGTFSTAGLAVGALVLGEAAMAPVNGKLVDRFGAARVVAACATCQGGLLLTLVVLGGAGVGDVPLIALCAVIGALVPPVSASARAIWPRLTPDAGALKVLFSLDASSQELIWTTGPMLVALGTALGGPRDAVLLTAVVTVSGGLLFAASPVARVRPERRAADHGVLIDRRGLTIVLLSVLLMGVGIGHVEVALPALAVNAGARGAAGVLLAVWSLGSMAGGLWYGVSSPRGSMRRRHALLLALLALSVAPLILAKGVLPALPLSFVAGLFCAPALSCQFEIIGSLAPQGRAAEVFSWSTSALVGGLALGTALSGQIVQALGVRDAFAAAVTALMLSALAATL